MALSLSINMKQAQKYVLQIPSCIGCIGVSGKPYTIILIANQENYCLDAAEFSSYVVDPLDGCITNPANKDYFGQYVPGSVDVGDSAAVSVYYSLCKCFNHALWI